MLLPKKPWKNNVKLRRAIGHAINRKAIVDNIYQGMGQAANNPIPPKMLGYNKSVPGFDYNIQKAKKLLAEAGYPNGTGLGQITLWSMPVPRPYNPDGVKVGEVMSADLAKIGIKAKIVTYNWGTYLKLQREQPANMDLFQLGWTGSNGDPDDFLSVLFDGLASSSINTQWHNQRYHQLMTKGKTLIDKTKRRKIYEEALQIIFDEAAVIPIAHSLVVIPMRKNVHNFNSNLLNEIKLKDVALE